MANIVIVTKQCYLLCEAINYIAINEIAPQDRNEMLDIFDPPGRVKSKKKRPKTPKTQKEPQFQIIIDFIPANNPNMNSQMQGMQQTIVNVTVSGRERTLALFSHMVEQIREQLPDNRFLDELVDRFLQEEDKDEHISR